MSVNMPSCLDKPWLQVSNLHSCAPAFPGAISFLLHPRCWQHEPVSSGGAKESDSLLQGEGCLMDRERHRHFLGEITSQEEADRAEVARKRKNLP